MSHTRRAIFSVAVANGLLLFGYGLSLPFFTVYLISRQGLSAAMAGLIIALSAMSRSVSSAIAGELSDVFGRKNLMLWGLAAEIAGVGGEINEAFPVGGEVLGGIEGEGAGSSGLGAEGVF